MTLGYLVSPVLVARLDCKYIALTFLASMSASMLGVGLSFLYPSLGPALAIPCLVVAGASYGLGVGPVPHMLMTTLFPQRSKSLGATLASICRMVAVFAQIKVSRGMAAMPSNILIDWKTFISVTSVGGLCRNAVPRLGKP